MEGIPGASSVLLPPSHQDDHHPMDLSHASNVDDDLQQQQQREEAEAQFRQQAEILASTMQVLSSHPPSPSTRPSAAASSASSVLFLPPPPPTTDATTTDSDEEPAATDSSSKRRVRRRLLDSPSQCQRSVNDHNHNPSSLFSRTAAAASIPEEGEEENSDEEEESDYEEPLVTPTRPRHRPQFSGNSARKSAGATSSSSGNPDLSLDGPFFVISSPPPRHRNPNQSPLKQPFTSPTSSASAASSHLHSPFRPSSRAVAPTSGSSSAAAAGGGSGTSATSRKGQKKKQNAAAPSPGEGTTGRSNDDGGKGLRHFSMKVCEAVKARHRTTYAQVADEVVDEMIAAPLIDSNGALVNDDGSVINPPPGGGAVIERGYIGKRGGKVDEKNVRRRVYDALNVLMAVGAITKENKDIQWIGLPDQMSEEIHTLKHARKTYQERIARKRKQLSDLLVQQVCLKNLIEHNQKRTTLPAAAAPTNANTTAAAAATGSSSQHQLQASGSHNAAATVVSAQSVSASPVRPSRSQSAAVATTAAAGSSLPPASPLRAKPPTVPRPQNSSGNSVTSPVKPNLPAHMGARYAPMLLSPPHSRQHSPVVARQHPGLPNAQQTGGTASSTHLAAPGSSAGSVVQSPLKPHHHPHSLLYNHSHPSISGSSKANAAAAAGTGVGSETASEMHTTSPALALPFLVLYTHQDNIVHVQQTDDRDVVDITLGGSFQIQEFWDLLRSLNLHLVQTWDLPRFIGSRELCAFYPREAFLSSESESKPRLGGSSSPRVGPERLQQRRNSTGGLPPMPSISSAGSRRPSVTHESAFTPSLTQSDPLVVAAAAAMAGSHSAHPPLRTASSPSRSSNSAMQIDHGAGVKHE